MWYSFSIYHQHVECCYDNRGRSIFFFILLFFLLLLVVVASVFAAVVFLIENYDNITCYYWFLVSDFSKRGLISNLIMISKDNRRKEKKRKGKERKGKEFFKFLSFQIWRRMLISILSAFKISIMYKRIL